MKKIIIQSLVAAVVLVMTVASGYAAERNDIFKILPTPQSVTMLKGKGIVYERLKFITAEQGTTIPVVGELIDALPRYDNGAKGIKLIMTNEGVPDSPEGYTLTLTQNGAEIKASTEAGLFYGCATLEQLMQDSRDFGAEIPAMEIKDYPALAYRAVHFDVKHHLSNMDYYYRAIDRLAAYKINAVIWELEDKLRYVSHPEVGASNAISKEEMQALCRYAKERNIEISPLVQGLGHASYILKHHWELREDVTNDGDFCPSEPKTYDMLFDLYSEAIEAMPYCTYLHIGGDEVNRIGHDKRCRDRGMDAFSLQMEWLNKVCQFAVENGKKPIVWDDMPLKFGGLWSIINADYNEQEVAKKWNSDKLDKAIDMFPSQCIYMRWKYENADTPANRRLLDWYRSKGLQVMGATAASAGDSPSMPRNDTRANYVRSFAKVASEYGMIGVLATAWDDGSPHWETIWRGFMAQAEYTWNPQGPDVEDLKAVHSLREFGITGSCVSQLIDSLERCAVFFDTSLVKKGSRNPAYGLRYYEMLTLPESDGAAGVWSKEYESKIAAARQQVARCSVVRDCLAEAQSHALRNRYTLDIYSQLCTQFDFPAQLILAVEAVDKASGDDRKRAIESLLALCDSFQALRDKQVEVYSRTRFMRVPDGYIADSGVANHLSAKSNDSSWMFIFEQDMINDIRNKYVK